MDWAATPQGAAIADAHARILRIGVSGRRRAGRRRRLHLGGRARRLYSSATHEDHLVDPDDTYVSTTWSASSASASPGCRGDRGRSGSRLPLLDVQIRNPACGVRPGAGDAPGGGRCCARRGLPPTAMSMPISTARSADCGRLRVAESCMRASIPPHACSMCISKRTLDRLDCGRRGVHVRTSSQAPFMRSTSSATSSVCARGRPRVHRAVAVGRRQAGDADEDLCVLATLKTGRPVQWESRESSSSAPPLAHQMTAKVRLGARSDGTLIAIGSGLSPNRAYGGHGGGRWHGARRPARGPIAARQKPTAMPFTPTCCRAALSWLRSSQTPSPSSAPLDDLAKKLGIDHSRSAAEHDPLR